jgi:biopolymer transport protein ExbD
MKQLAIRCFSAVAILTAAAAAEIQVRFDDGGWVRPAEEIGADGVCFTAPANLPLGKLKDAGLPEELVAFPVRLALLGQEGRGARLDPLVRGRDRSMNVILVVIDAAELTVADVPVERLADLGTPPAEVATMDADLTRLGDFLKVVKAGVERTQARGELPRAIVIGRSGTSFGLLVRTFQLLRTQGCRSGMLRVDDGFPSFSFEVKRDPDVAPPVADRPAAVPTGRLVVNIFADGTLAAADGSGFADDAALRGYLEAGKSRMEAQGKDPALFLRGDKAAVFKHCRRVVRIGARAGVDRVIFGTYAMDEPNDGSAGVPSKEPAAVDPVEEDGVSPEVRPEVHEHDLSMALPKPGGVDPALATVVTIQVDAAGRVSRLHGVGVLDEAGAGRTLPGLTTELEGLIETSGGGPENLSVKLMIAPECKQQRLVDVLNVLAGLGIAKATFVEKEE